MTGTLMTKPMPQSCKLPFAPHALSLCLPFFPNVPVLPGPLARPSGLFSAFLSFLKNLVQRSFVHVYGNE